MFPDIPNKLANGKKSNNLDLQSLFYGESNTASGSLNYSIEGKKLPEHPPTRKNDNLSVNFSLENDLRAK